MSGIFDFITPGLGSVISGGLSAGTSLFGGLFGAAGQQAANAQQFQQSEMLFNQQQTANQHFMDQSEAYNTLMQNTAYQRQMESMYEAGLNPILAAGQGPMPVSSPMASVSGGGSPVVGNPGSSIQAAMEGIGRSISNTALFKAALTQADKDASQVDLNKATTGATNATTGLTNAQTSRTAQDERTGAAAEDANRAAAANSRASAAVNAATVGLVNEQTNSARARAQIDQMTANEYRRGVPVNEGIGSALWRLFRGSADPSVKGIDASATTAKTLDTGTKSLTGVPFFSPSNKIKGIDK